MISNKKLFLLFLNDDILIGFTIHIKINMSILSMVIAAVHQSSYELLVIIL